MQAIFSVNSFTLIHLLVGLNRFFTYFMKYLLLRRKSLIKGLGIGKTHIVPNTLYA